MPLTSLLTPTITCELWIRGLNRDRKLWFNNVSDMAYGTVNDNRKIECWVIPWRIRVFLFGKAGRRRRRFAPSGATIWRCDGRNSRTASALLEEQMTDPRDAENIVTRCPTGPSGSHEEVSPLNARHIYGEISEDTSELKDISARANLRE